jgi:hypothetical protein
MIRSLGEIFFLNLFSNSKWARTCFLLQINEVAARIESLSGPLLVSSIGDAGCTESGPKVPKHLLIRSQRRALVHLDSRNVIMEVETV